MAEYSLQRTRSMLLYDLPVFYSGLSFWCYGNHKDCTVVNSPGLVHRLGPLSVLFFCALPLGPRDLLVAFVLNALSTDSVP